MPHNVRDRTQEDLRPPMAVNPKKLRPYDEPPKVRRPLIPNAPDSATAAFLVVSLLWLGAATGIGLLWAALLLFPDQLNLTVEFQLPLLGALGVELSRDTVQSGFTNALVYGWLSNAAFAAILFVTPRLTGARLLDDAMGFVATGVWNVAVAAGIVTVYIPSLSDVGPLAEFPLPVDGLLLLALLMVTGVVARTLLSAERRMPYVSILFFGVALLAFLGALTLGAGATLLPLDETARALVNAFVARLIGTYWVLGAALGALFYVVPRATANPLASSGMALLAWGLWAAFAGLSGLGALADPSVPFAITSLGHAGTLLLVAPIFLSVANLALTIRGRWTLALGTGTLAFALIAMTFLLGTSLLEAIGTLRTVDAHVRGTEWGMGVWLLGTLGSATFALFAFIDHAAPRVFKRDWTGSFTVDAQLWATMIGVAIAAFALIAAGIAHGSLLAEGAPADEIQSTLFWFYLGAGAGLSLAALGGLAALISLFLMYTTARRAEYIPIDDAPAADAPAAAQAAH